jgi:hypothetical protein
MAGPTDRDSSEHREQTSPRSCALCGDPAQRVYTDEQFLCRRVLHYISDDGNEYALSTSSPDTTATRCLKCCL